MMTLDKEELARLLEREFGNVDRPIPFGFSERVAEVIIEHDTEKRKAKDRAYYATRGKTREMLEGSPHDRYDGGK
jgi:hypothetical protein